MNLKNVEVLNLCRDEQEIKALLNKFNIIITSEKLNEIKESFNQHEKIYNSLTKKQLDKIAGGIFKLGGVYYTRKQAEDALDHIRGVASTSGALETQPLLSQGHNHRTDEKTLQLIQLHNNRSDDESKRQFTAALQQIIDDHDVNSIKHYSEIDLKHKDEKKIGLFTSKPLKDSLKQIPRETCDDMDIAQLDKINNCNTAATVITGVLIAGCAVTLIYNIVNVAKK